MLSRNLASHFCVSQLCYSKVRACSCTVIGSIRVLTCFLNAGLQGQNTLSAVDLLLSQPAVMDNLRKALLGNYSVILSLLGCVDNGSTSKRLADRIIDSCTWAISWWTAI